MVRSFIVKKKNKNIKGISLLEALVSTAIIGIGFVAILQMTNYSVQSITTSGERTKANFLINMIAEDAIANRSTGITLENFSEYVITDLQTDDNSLSSFCKKKQIRLVIQEIYMVGLIKPQQYKGTVKELPRK